MPRRNERGAPTFSGQPEDLERFFQDVEIVSEGCQLDDRRLMRWACTYARTQDEDMWQKLPAFTDPLGTWVDFKDQVLDEFPGSRRGIEFTVSDLEEWAALWGKKEIRNNRDYGEFDRHFRWIAQFLVDRGNVSDREMDLIYRTAFTGEIASILTTRLIAMYPMQKGDRPYSVEQFRKALEYTFDGTAGLTANAASRDASVAPPSLGRSGVSHGRVSRAADTTPRVKEESIIAELRDGFKMMQTQLADLVSQQRPTRAAFTGNTAGPRAGFTPNYSGPPRGCLFCGDLTHFIRECGVLMEYERAGKCIRVNGRTTFPDGRLIGRFDGRTIKECIDMARPGTLANSPASVSSNLFEMDIEEESRGESRNEYTATSAYIEQDLDDDDDTEMELRRFEALVTETQKKLDAKNAKRKVRFDGIEIPTSRVGPAARPATVDKGKQPAAGSSQAGGATRAPIGAPAQFRYHAPGEDPSLTGAAINRALDTQLTITLREAISMSGDVRNSLKNLVATKRFPVAGPMPAPVTNVNAVELYNTGVAKATLANGKVSDEGAEEGLECYSSLPLRIIDATFMGMVTAECILDSGSQFIAMRRDVWEKTGLTVNPEKSFVVEAANRSTSRTLGAVKDVSMRVGEVELKVVVHVVEEAGFEVLLGRPFFALTRSHLVDEENGGQVLRIHDPEDGKAVLVPTRDRIRDRGRAPLRTRATGF